MISSASAVNSKTVSLIQWFSNCGMCTISGTWITAIIMTLESSSENQNSSYLPKKTELSWDISTVHVRFISDLVGEVLVFSAVVFVYLQSSQPKYKKSWTYGRCRKPPRRWSWCSRRRSPPTAADTPPGGGRSPLCRWCWDLQGGHSGFTRCFSSLFMDLNYLAMTEHNVTAMQIRL